MIYIHRLQVPHNARRDGAIGIRVRGADHVAVRRAVAPGAERLERLL